MPRINAFKFATSVVAIVILASVSIAQTESVGPEEEKNQIENADKKETIVNESNTEKNTESTPSPTQNPVNNETLLQNESLHRWRIALGLGLSLGSTLKFDDVRSGSSTGKVEIRYKEGLTGIVEARYLKSNSWGFIGGVSSDSEREVDRMTIESGGTSITIAAGSGPSKLQTSHIFANASYVWEAFYLGFGLNYSFVKFTPATGYAARIEDEGGVGAQLGVGINIHPNIALEAWSRATAVKLKIDDTDFGTGYLSQLLLQGKYIF